MGMVLLTASLSSGAEPPVSPATFASWLAFDKPVTFDCRLQPNPTTNERRPNPFGDPLWGYGYSSKTQTLHSYSIALFPGGTLFRDKRRQMEETISQQIEKLKTVSTESRQEMGIAIQERPDGRKVFFTVMGFGPGGAGYGAFCTLEGGAYDLLVTHTVDFEDDMPQEQRLKDPAKPGKELTDVFALIEDRVSKAVKNGATNHITTKQATLIVFAASGSVPSTNRPDVQVTLSDPSATWANDGGSIRIQYTNNSLDVTLTSSGYKSKTLHLSRPEQTSLVGFERDEHGQKK
ncbi:MAG TPA: hypothetical protein PLE77_12170 [Kiritimatiellia bacterium]|nr:hypothetical protein [Kiritimatiellia bacterium]